MKTSETIHRDIQRRFERDTNKRIQEGSVMDFYTVAMSKALEGVYEKIENSKNPHIYTNLRGQALDDTGFFVNCPRRPGEDDETYLYRLMNWNISAEASNTTAIHDALLNLEYASNAEYVPLTNGSGTGTVFIIPRHYDNETITSCLKEAQERLAKVASPSLVIDYVIPTIRAVKLHLHITSKYGDTELIQDNLHQAIKNYINNIPPGEYLQIGTIRRLGVNEPGVDYFDILQVFIDDEEHKEIEILQAIQSKFILDEIIWS